MKLFAVAALFAATVVALPEGPEALNQKENTCGESKPKCCNGMTKKLGADEAGGLLGLLPNKALDLDHTLGEYEGCSDLLGLGGNCQNKPVCCDDSKPPGAGVINVNALNCVGLL